VGANAGIRRVLWRLASVFVIAVRPDGLATGRYEKDGCVGWACSALGGEVANYVSSFRLCGGHVLVFRFWHRGWVALHVANVAVVAHGMLWTVMSAKWAMRGGHRTTCPT